ncbi:hypothetical protein EVG20_g1975 [Dentipellis fragilis]|uniref:Uncharacterized protein n=1 Tax=Dentipellis fragilis TaxID=205917 RepID=A0A4Y9Z9A4_9AGAM|nr:hypothetical protein EVG20_g1975 [Dentipellis fragilis]
MSSSAAMQSQPVASTSHAYLQPPPPARLKSSSRSSRTLSSVQEQPVASTSRAVHLAPRPANSQQDTLQVPSAGHGRRRTSPSHLSSRSAPPEQQPVASTSRAVITSTPAQGHADIKSSPPAMKSSPPAAPPAHTVSASEPSSGNTPPSVTKPDSPTPSTYSAHLRTIAGLSDLITRWRGKAVPSVTKYSSDTPETHPSLPRVPREGIVDDQRVHNVRVRARGKARATLEDREGGPAGTCEGVGVGRVGGRTIHYSARPVATNEADPWSNAKDPGCPINLHKTDDMPAVMRIKSRSRKFLREDD